MKYKLFLIYLVITSCTINSTSIDKRIPLNSKGFAYIYNDFDYDQKIISGKLNNNEVQIAHTNLPVNTLIKIINPKTKDSIVVKNFKKIDYPDFYKILITKQVANNLNINPELPFVEILEIKKNKSFIAKKAKVFHEEKKIPSKAPVANVEISNISKNKSSNKIDKNNVFYIFIGSFYSTETTEFLKKRIKKEISNFDIKKLQIRNKSNKKSNLLAGPYNTINLMKNDYILLKKFGFEELDIIINE